VRRSGEDNGPRTAVLVRRQRVNLDDVSRKGCRFKGAEPLDVGHVGMLAVTIAGHVHVELFRVARSSSLPDSEWLYETGIEFLPMPAGTPSLHDLAAQLDHSHSS
jgi:hypothetical protein